MKEPKKYVYYCPICGKSLSKSNRKTKYCSYNCRDEEERRRGNIRAYVDRTPYVKIRFEIFTRDSFTCQYCGRNVQDGIKLEVDHIKPLSKGGTNSLDNLITACSDCNIGKKDILLSQRLERKIRENLADIG